MVGAPQRQNAKTTFLGVLFISVVLLLFHVTIFFLSLWQGHQNDRTRRQNEENVVVSFWCERHNDRMTLAEISHHNLAIFVAHFEKCFFAYIIIATIILY